MIGIQHSLYLAQLWFRAKLHTWHVNYVARHYPMIASAFL